MVRRDRSLGGREVVVGSAVKRLGESERKSFGGFGNPLSPAQEKSVSGGSERVSSNWVRVEKKLPKWWPISMPRQGFTGDVQEYQREANRLIRGMDYKFYFMKFQVRC